MIKVTVVVPVYNTEKYLKRCLDSIVKQTLKEIEIIIINDCSSDNSKEIINEFKSENVQVIENKTNKGIGYNRNLGIKKAKGQYICFIDSDDYLEYTFLEKMYNKAVRSKNDLVICNYNRVLEEENNYKIIEPDYYIEGYSDTTLEKSPSLLNDVNLAPWNKLYKKELIENIKFPEDLKYEDAIFVISAISESKNIGFIEDKLNYYLIRNKSETTVVNEKVFDILKILDLIYNKLNKKKYFEHIKNNLEYLFITVIFRYTLQQKYQINKDLKNKFIDEAFMFLNNTFPDWKNNKFYKKRNILKRIIESNKLLSKLYCKF